MKILLSAVLPAFAPAVFAREDTENPILKEVASKLENPGEAKPEGKK